MVTSVASIHSSVVNRFPDMELDLISRCTRKLNISICNLSCTNDEIGVEIQFRTRLQQSLFAVRCCWEHLLKLIKRGFGQKTNFAGNYDENFGRAVHIFKRYPSFGVYWGLLSRLIERGAPLCWFWSGGHWPKDWVSNTAIAKENFIFIIDTVLKSQPESPLVNSPRSVGSFAVEEEWMWMCIMCIQIRSGKLNIYRGKKKVLMYAISWKSVSKDLSKW